MVASVLSPRPSLDTKDTSSSNNGSKTSRKMSGFGALLRRASQRGGFATEQQQPVDINSSSSNEPREGLGRMAVKSKSLRGLEGYLSSASSDNRQGLRRSLDMEGSDHSDGPTGVSTLLSQIAQVACVDKPSFEKPKVERGSSGVLRGLLRRAASLHNMQPSRKSSKEQPDLEPVLVMTDENRGKVVFQNLDVEGLTMNMNHLNMDTNNFHESLPDLSGLGTSNSSRSTEASSSTDSPVAAAKLLHQLFQTPERKSATSRNDTFPPDHVLYVNVDHQPADPPSEPEQQPSSKGFRGRLRTFFKRTKSGRTVTEEAVGEGPHVYVPPQPVVSPMYEIALPSLIKPEDQQQMIEKRQQKVDLPRDDYESSEPHSLHIRIGLMDVVQEYEDFANEESRSCCSDDEDDYFEGDDESYNSQSEGDSEAFDEEPPEVADATEALEYFMSSYCPEPFKDIQVEPQPARVYDELEIFYEEMTFEHVGGSMLLGAASQLLTVPESDAEEFGEEGEEAEEEI
jgi:hypothetical protein